MTYEPRALYILIPSPENIVGKTDDCVNRSEIFDRYQTSDVTLTAVWEAPAETSTISGFAIAIVAMVLVTVLYGRRS